MFRRFFRESDHERLFNAIINLDLHFLIFVNECRQAFLKFRIVRLERRLARMVGESGVQPINESHHGDCCDGSANRRIARGCSNGIHEISHDETSFRIDVDGMTSNRTFDSGAFVCAERQN